MDSGSRLLAGDGKARSIYRQPLVTMSQPISDTPRVRAPEFPAGLDWIHTNGHSLTLESLRGNIVLLDFWTYG